MIANWPRINDLPDTVSVFPLSGALLLPFAQLPLNIFEPRYLALVEDALAAGRMFGMVQPRATGQETVADSDPIYDIGCLGRITRFTETDDGRFGITLTGLCRFRVAEELSLHRGYRRIAADYATFAGDLEPPAGELDDRSGLIDALKCFFRAQEIEIDWQALDESPDAHLVTSLAMGCPFKPEEKQSLLEAETLGQRARQLRAILEMSVHDSPGARARH